MRGLKLAANLPWTDIPEIVDITDTLPKKGSWESIKKTWKVKGVWDGVTYNQGFRDPADIDTIVIHHSGPPDGTLESHANYHAEQWGAGIAYHICIDKGRIYQTNNLLSMTFHAGNNNTYTVGIEINRDLSNSDLTDIERKLLYAAILSVKAVLPIKEIKGHRELPTAATACPATSEDRIRADILAIEEQIAYNTSPTANSATAYSFALRVMDLGKKLETVWASEAKRKLTLLTPIMVDIGGWDGTVEGMAKRINGLYNEAQNGKFKDEATRKLLIGAKYAKELGML